MKRTAGLRKRWWGAAAAAVRAIGAGGIVAAASAGVGLAAAAPAAAQDAVVLRPSFEPGRTDAYLLEATFETASAVEGSDAVRRERLEQTARVRVTTTEVDRAGVATVRVAFDELRAARTVNSGGDETKQPFAWPAEEGAQPGTAAPFAAMYSVLATKGLELQVQPDGTVRAIAGMDEVYGAGDKAGEAERTRLLGMFAPASAAQQLSAIWRIDPGERRTPRRPGDTWSTAGRTPLGPLGAAVVTTRYTLKGTTDAVAEVSGDTSVRLEPPLGMPDAAAPAAQVNSHEGSERARWDVARGRVLERERVGETSWRVQLATSVPIVTTTTTSERTRITLAAEQPAAPEPATRPEP